MSLDLNFLKICRRKFCRLLFGSLRVKTQTNYDCKIFKMFHRTEANRRLGCNPHPHIFVDWCEMKIAEFANSADLDEVVHNEPPHLDLDCLPS